MSYVLTYIAGLLTIPLLVIGFILVTEEKMQP
jgi:hypothetical protein